MNTELLNKISEYIQEEPRRLDMDHLFLRVDPNTKKDIHPPCGTVGCIAGWACILSGVNIETENDLWDKAGVLLDLSIEESGRLFSEPNIAVFNTGEDDVWPFSLAEEYEEAGTPKERADVTVRRIKLFIETNGEE